VLLVDDQALLRLGFRLVLEAEDDLEVVGEAGDGAEGVRLATRLAPDVVLMDVRMPGVNGIEATERIVASGSGARVLILTTFDLDEYAFAALRAGASGFLLKDAHPAELIAAIRAVATGDAVVSPRVTRRMLEMFSGSLPSPGDPALGDVDPRIAQLTPREVEVLRVVAEGLSNAEIARCRRRRSRRTSGASWPSSGCGTGCRPWCSRTSRGSSAAERVAEASDLAEHFLRHVLDRVRRGVPARPQHPLAEPAGHRVPLPRERDDPDEQHGRREPERCCRAHGS
jgi:DNA-binding NarL/FixJ family response regulator